MRAYLNLVSIQLLINSHSKQISKVKSSDHQWCLILGLAVWHSFSASICWMLDYKHSRSSLVFRICNILFLEFSADRLNLPMPFPASLASWCDEQQSPHENNIVQMRPFLHNDPPWKVYTSAMFSIQIDKQTSVFCSIWLTGSIIYLFKEVQQRKSCYLTKLPVNWTKDHWYCH